MSARLSGPGGYRCPRSISSHTLPHQQAESASLRPHGTMVLMQHATKGAGVLWDVAPNTSTHNLSVPLNVIR